MNRILYVGQGGTTAGHGDVYRCDIAVNVCDETTDFSVAYDSATATNAATETTYCFRLTNAGSITNFTYTQTPSITLMNQSSSPRPQTGGGGSEGSGGGGGS
jgi:hypothetical protein